MLRLGVCIVLIVTMIENICCQNSFTFIGTLAPKIGTNGIFNTGMSNNGYTANGTYFFAVLNAKCSYQLFSFVPYRRLFTPNLTLNGYIESSAYVQGKYGTINSSLYSQ